MNIFNICFILIFLTVFSCKISNPNDENSSDICDNMYEYQEELIFGEIVIINEFYDSSETLVFIETYKVVTSIINDSANTIDDFEIGIYINDIFITNNLDSIPENLMNTNDTQNYTNLPHGTYLIRHTQLGSLGTDFLCDYQQI